MNYSQAASQNVVQKAIRGGNVAVLRYLQESGNKCIADTAFIETAMPQSEIVLPILRRRTSHDVELLASEIAMPIWQPRVKELVRLIEREEDKVQRCHVYETYSSSVSMGSAVSELKRHQKLCLTLMTSLHTICVTDAEASKKVFPAFRNYVSFLASKTSYEVIRMVETSDEPLFSLCPERKQSWFTIRETMLSNKEPATIGQLISLIVASHITNPLQKEYERECYGQ